MVILSSAAQAALPRAVLAKAVALKQVDRAAPEKESRPGKPPAEWARAAEYLTELRRSADQADARAFAAHDLDFHTQFYLLSGHRRLADVWEQYCAGFEPLAVIMFCMYAAAGLIGVVFAPRNARV
jgi:DNA-binding GntR family transcriptional regulator